MFIMNKNFRTSAIVAVAVAILVPTAFAVNYALEAESVPDTYAIKDQSSSVYPVNEQGQTYGEGPFKPGIGQEPDLIKAVDEKGVEGYVKSSDLLPGVSSPEEAMEYQKSADAAGSKSIPLYKSDGKTVIGQFKFGSNGD